MHYATHAADNKPHGRKPTGAVFCSSASLMKSEACLLFGAEENRPAQERRPARERETLPLTLN